MHVAFQMQSSCIKEYISQVAFKTFETRRKYFYLNVQHAVYVPT